MKYLPMLKEVEIPQFIVASCVLHNFILARHGMSLEAVPDFEDDDDGDDDYETSYVAAISSRDGEDKRESLSLQLYLRLNLE